MSAHGRDAVIRVGHGEGGGEPQHGQSFEEAAAVFLDAERVDFDASHAGDGEERRKVVGMIDGFVFVVVYTLRPGTIRLISARRANAQEERRYGNR